jgi:hypothetical protein
MDVILLNENISVSASRLVNEAPTSLIKKQIQDLMKLNKLIICARGFSFDYKRFTVNDGSEQDAHPKSHVGGTLVKVWSPSTAKINQLITYTYRVQEATRQSTYDTQLLELCERCNSAVRSLISHRSMDLVSQFRSPVYYFGPVSDFNPSLSTYENYGNYVQRMRRETP